MSSAAARRVLIAVAVCLCALLAATAGAAAQSARGIDPNQGQSLVEVELSSKAAAMRLQLRAKRYGVEFNEHYLRNNADGSVTATVFGTARGLARLDRAGYDARVHDRGPGHLGGAGRRAKGGQARRA